MVACKELTIVKSYTVVKEQFNIGNDKTSAVFVDRMAKLVVNLCEAVYCSI